MTTADSTTQDPKSVRRYGVLLFVLSLFFFGIIPYGGIRSSDSEVVFRVAEALADHGQFYLQHDLEDWHSFGVATGRSDHLYAIFGPLESILLAPVIKVAEVVNETGWYNSIVPMLALSHFEERGFFDYLDGSPTKNPKPHALRMLTSFFNVLVSAFCVFVFWRILLIITGSISASFFVSILYAIATHAWVYAGTFFSEPLATLLVLLSFLYLLRSRDASMQEQEGPSIRPTFLSGLWLGFAITAHITAALYAPFFAFYFLWEDFGSKPGIASKIERAVVFSLGVFILLFLLGWYNYFRFGSFFETGRSVSALSGEVFGYGTFVWPFRGLYGLIFGAGKGIIFFMPVLVVGTFLSKHFLRWNRRLFWIVAAALACRILFIASRSDWHGGFCLGPRYLIMTIPFFLIPVAVWLRNQESTRFARAYGVMAFAGLLFSIEQLYFCLIEIFTSLQVWKFNEMLAGFSVFENDVLYLDWKYSPLLNPGAMRIAPFLLRWVHLPLSDLMMYGSLLLTAFFVILFLLTLKMPGSVSDLNSQASPR